MSFYSYKNASPECCPGKLTADSLRGIQEKVCVQVTKVYDSCLQQEQIDDYRVTIDHFFPVPNCNCPEPCGDVTEGTPAPCINLAGPITFQSCRSSTTCGTLRNVTVDRMCDRPCFARVRAHVDIPIDILFVDAHCNEYIARGTVTVFKDVLLTVPDESIVPFTLDSLVSAICVAGEYVGDDTFRITICVTVILKILAEVQILIPSFGYCPIPPCEEFADNVCDEFFSLPLFPQMDACNTTSTCSDRNNSCCRRC